MNEHGKGLANVRRNERRVDGLGKGRGNYNLKWIEGDVLSEPTNLRTGG